MQPDELCRAQNCVEEEDKMESVTNDTHWHLSPNPFSEIPWLKIEGDLIRKTTIEAMGYEVKT